MTAWLVAALAGALFAAIQYGRLIRRGGRPLVALAALRALAVAMLVALLLDARVGRETLPPPLVALDASRSWTRADPSRWAAAVARARALGGDSLLLTGDSIRPADDAAQPTDLRSAIGPLTEQASAQGRPLILVTDGELTATDVAGIQALPRGSRVELIAGRRAVDIGIAALTAPAAVDAGDTLRATATIRSGNVPVPASRIALLVDETVVASADIPPMPAHAEREVALAARVAGGEGTRLLRAVASAPGDAEPRNDTLGVSLDVAAASGAVWISSAPDLDGRAALALLRGALAVPTRAFLRVAPGAWRVEGTLAPVGEAMVRDAVRSAPMLIIHGDTAIFGDPRRLASGAPLALLPGPDPSTATPAAAGPPDEWYPSGAPPSPASASLAGTVWDSLTPVSLGAAARVAERAESDAWIALEGRRGRRGDPAPFVSGTERPRRVVVSRATGTWRWKARGGAGAAAYDGLWGSLFDWLADGRRDRRAAVPEHRLLREGDAVAWRLSSPTDAAVSARLSRRGDAGGAQTLSLRPGRGAMIASSPSLPAGVYDVTTAGGRSILVVNVADELVPRPPAVAVGPAGSGAVAATVPALRDYGIAYALIVALLCVEWILRRRQGLQ